MCTINTRTFNCNRNPPQVTRFVIFHLLTHSQTNEINTEITQTLRPRQRSYKFLFCYDAWTYVHVCTFSRGCRRLNTITLLVAIVVVPLAMVSKKGYGFHM